jgi:hypothetical protein
MIALKAAARKKKESKRMIAPPAGEAEAEERAAFIAPGLDQPES